MFASLTMDREVLSAVREPDRLLFLARQHSHSTGAELSLSIDNTLSTYTDNTVPYLITDPTVESGTTSQTAQDLKQAYLSLHHLQPQSQAHPIPHRHHHRLHQQTQQKPEQEREQQQSSTDSATGSSNNERARTGLVVTMDLLCAPPHTELSGIKEPSQGTPIQSATQSTPVSPPSVSSTPSARQSGFNVSPSAMTELDSVGPIRQDSGVDTSMPPKKLYSDDIPVLDSFPGFYGFDLFRPLCGDTYEAAETKPSTSFFFFKDEQGWTNLYSKKTPAWWTLSYWCQRQPPEGSFLRLTPVYGTSDKQQEVIQRCFEDFMAMPTNSLARYSIIVVGNSSADYFYDPNTERLCVTLPYERPKEGCEYSQFNGKFMCFNSCLHNGGQGNKKPLFLIVTLERLVAGTEPSKGQCEVLGRQCIKFRSCACPKRDKENSERRTGDSICGSTQGSGKRKKDLERGDRHNKKWCPQTQDFGATGTKHSFHLNGRWQSPGHELFAHDGSNPLGEDDNDEDSDPRHSRLFVDQDTGSSVIQYNGESYHMLLIPTGLPGGLETLAGVRFGLLRTWLYAQSVMMKQSSPSTNRSTNVALKPEVLSENTVTENENRDDPSQTYLPGRNMEPDTVLHQLLTIESQLAHVIRERIYPTNGCHGPYPYGGESTDSQPNSNGAVVGLSLGSVDETAHANHEFSTAANVGPLSSDSGVSSDAIQHHTPLLMNGNFPSVSLAHRPGLYPTSGSQTSTGYDPDYGNRFQNHLSVGQLYPPHLMNNTQLRNSIGLSGYFPEITDNYPVLHTIPHSQATSPISDRTGASSNLNSVVVDHADAAKSTTTTTTSAQVRGSRTEGVTLPTSLSAFTSTVFYPTSYFGSRPTDNSDQTNPNSTSLLDPFSRGHLTTGAAVGMSTSTNGVSTGLCFYPAVGPTTLSESLLIHEEVISNYLDREKSYDETDGGHQSVLLTRNPIHRRCSSFGSSSPQSPGSSCCDQTTLLEV
ncbi:Cellular tumor antigen p53 [Fasciola hepatica]|uniref:Cellular tumor antigen p53 n=1 Tax=Fasciola hepatica TaxID=6192 RepID=A0A4E0S3E8_FASHE|nr:Cellular tumor antigen p53 [Fasciola hepatica]